RAFRFAFLSAASHAEIRRAAGTRVCLIINLESKYPRTRREQKLSWCSGFQIHLRPDYEMKKEQGFATRAIHAGQRPDPTTGAVMTPIYATSTYVQESPGKHKGFDYARSINPTRLAYENCISNLESGIRGFAFASGLAAMATALELLDSGSHVVASDDL